MDRLLELTENLGLAHDKRSERRRDTEEMQDSVVADETFEARGHSRPAFLDEEVSQGIEGSDFIMAGAHGRVDFHAIARTEQEGLTDPPDAENAVEEQRLLVVCPSQALTNIHGGGLMTEADEDHASAPHSNNRAGCGLPSMEGGCPSDPRVDARGIDERKFGPR
jgi:hypothetical protein